MKQARSKRSVAFLMMLAVVLSCRAPDVAGPQVSAPQNDLLGGLLGGTLDLTSSLLKATGLLKCNPMPTYTASKTIGAAGGTIVVGPHKLVVPPNALNAPVTITAVAPHDNVNRIEFSPEGLVFNKSTSLTMSYANCSLLAGLLPRIAYVGDQLNILEYLLGSNNIFARTVTGQLKHFSGYAVAW